MLSELFLYDRDHGLFKEILNKSTVMEGRYHVSPNYGRDLNSGNLQSFFEDPKYGVNVEKQRFPIAVCMTPQSRFTKINEQRWEEFWFSIYFLTKSYNTADNQVKDKHPDSGLSSHHIWYDWQDMKNCADAFLQVLKMQMKKEITLDFKTTPLRTQVQFDENVASFNRVSLFGNAGLTGVTVNFTVFMFKGNCSLQDYPVTDGIIIPNPIIHPLHKQ